MARSRDLNKQAAAMNAPRSAAARKKRASKFSTPLGKIQFARTGAKKKAGAQATLGTGAGGRANAAALAKRKASAKKKAGRTRARSQAKLRTRLHGNAKTKKVGTSARKIAGAKRPSYGVKRR